MPPYHLYTALDFTLDEAFLQWVLHPDIKSNYQWESWLRAHPEKEETVHEAIRLVKSVAFRDYSMDRREKEQLWDDIWLNIAGEQTEDEYKPIRKQRSMYWPFAAAAALLLAIGAWWLLRPQPVFHPVTASITTLPGETKRLRLPDSSEVLLNAASRLTYAQKDAHHQEVWLDGEACFYVRHSTNCFTVHTDDQLSVQVLGTVFNICNRGSKVAVILKEGSIRLNISEAQLYLRPGEMISYDKTDGAYTKTSTDTIKAMAWTRGQLMMDEYTVADAISFMQQVFDRHLFVNDPKVLQYKVSGSMPIIYNADTMQIQFEKAFKIHFHTNHVKEN